MFGSTRMDPARLVGDYELGSRIGSGSFAIVWRARHRPSDLEVAVKEIDKKLLGAKVRDSLLKEISILRTIDHPNIIRLYETIETSERIYLVLEYCCGGDLADYIYRNGKVSESIARHFMRQLAAGLQILQEKHLIHRDIKPQNLLLSTNEVTPLLKIGDFGFARSVAPDNLADTFCGSPLYMAPEIIRNQKYDAKADLWSAGAILFQLVTGKPPFDGNNHIELFQNIVRGTELQFPGGALQELHPDCVDLCRSLLRRNPIERLTFREFFNHKFLQEPRQTLDIEQAQSTPPSESNVKCSDSTTSGKKSLLLSAQPGSQSRKRSSATDTREKVEIYSSGHGSSSSASSSHLLMPHVSYDKTRNYVEGQLSSNQPGVVDSLEFIEREYVLVNPHSTSMETSSYYLDTSLQETGLPSFPRRSDEGSSISVEAQRPASSCSTVAIPASDVSVSQPTVSGTYLVKEVRRPTTIHPPTRLKLLRQYVQALTEVAQEMYDAGHVRDSFAVDLVVLALWSKALDICDSWMMSGEESLPPGTNSRSEPATNQCPSTDPGTSGLEFSSPVSAKSFVAQEFVVAYNRAENSSNQLKGADAAAKMPDAMEAIYERALAYGKTGGVDEYMNNKTSAATLYSKAILLLSFILEEAVTLQLNPPFSLTPDDKERIHTYLSNLQFRRSHL